MIKYSIGDKVIINSDLTEDITGISEEELRDWKGKEAKIIATNYVLNIDDGFYIWNQSWFTVIN